MQNRQKARKDLISEILQKLKNNYHLDGSDNLLKKLYGFYRSRYMDNQKAILDRTSKELDEVDHLWVHLVNQLPMPDEIKYSSIFFAMLFNEDMKKVFTAIKSKNKK